MKNKEEKIEMVKNYWDSRPCNIKHSSKEIGSIEYFDEVEKRRYTVEPHILEFADFKNCNNKKILEIGCGIGTDTVMFAKNGGIVTAVDISKKSLEVCKNRFKVTGNKAKIKYADAENLSDFIKVEPYDIIYSFGVIHHTPSPQKAVGQIKKYCDKNTVIKLMFYSKYSWKGISFFLKHGWKFGFNYKKTTQYFAEAQLNCPVAEIYSRNELRDLFRDFDIVKIEKKHIFPYQIKKYIKGDLKKTFMFRYMPEGIYKILSRLLGWHYLITLKIK